MTLTKEEIAVAVKDPAWQRFRCGLTGLSTTQKLACLNAWLAQRKGDRMTQVQVENYINALKRGGFVDLDGKVVR